MKTLALVVSLVLVPAAPAAATTWDFSWTSSVFFPGFRDLVEAAEGYASGQNTATITSMTGAPGGVEPILVIDFQVGRIDVFDVAALTGLEATGPSIPIENPPRFSPTGEPVDGFGEPGLRSFQDFGLGSYEWTGPREDPRTFTITLSAPGSGPDPRRTFSGVGVRRAEASEPAALAVFAVALAAAVWARRRLQAS